VALNLASCRRVIEFGVIRSTLLLYGLACVISFVGACSLAAHFLRPKPKDRILLWTALFAGIYALRMFAQPPLATSIPLFAGAAAYVQSSLNFLILIPALLFTEELYGRGWKDSLRMLRLLVAAYGAVGIVVNALLRAPAAVPDPAVVVGATAFVIVGVGAWRGYQPPVFPESRVLLAGVGAFLLFVAYEHAVGAGLLRMPARVEPIGYLISVLCLGYIGATRFFRNARQVAATDSEMRAAQRIQASILPRELPSANGVAVVARYLPLDAVAGDFYDVVSLGNGSVVVIVADVSGHGVPAALIASMVKVAFVAEANRSSAPGQILAAMNTTLCGLFDGAYVTAACLVVEHHERRLHYSLAGHPPPIIVPRRGAALALDKGGMFLGMFPSAQYPTTTVRLDDDARVVIYTDGLTEAMATGSDEMFGLDRLVGFAESAKALASPAFADALLGCVGHFTGRMSPENDDVTVVVVDVTF
jgi:phosphoserine phosphatase RsbU/P